jgi:hypothetical protein
VPKKTDDDIRPSALLSRGQSFERAAWLAKMLRAADQRELADPTEDDIAEMRMALGDDRTFAALPDDKKALLFLAMLAIRERLKIYREWVKFEEEPAGPLLSPLASLLCSPSRTRTQSSTRAARKPSAGIGRSCAEPGAERETTVDQTLIRGLVTAFRVFVSGLSSV